MLKPRILVTVYVAAIAFLVGVWGISFSKTSGTDLSIPFDSAGSESVGSPRAIPDSTVDVRNATVVSDVPPATVYPGDAESEGDQPTAPPTLQEVAQRAPAGRGTGIFVNGRELTRQQIAALFVIYRQVLPPGRYWYDGRSGAWGFEGRETMGVILPRHNLGPLSPAASGGNSGIFINGRELNWIEKLRLQQTFRTTIPPSRWWLDGRTGYYGREGNPIPLGNFRAVLAQQGGGQVQTDVEHVGMGVHTSSTGCNAVFTGNVAAFPGC